MMIVTITKAGLDRLAEATPSHLEGVHRLFLRPIGATRTAQLARAWPIVLKASSE